MACQATVLLAAILSVSCGTSDKQASSKPSSGEAAFRPDVPQPSPGPPACPSDEQLALILKNALANAGGFDGEIEMCAP